MSAEQRCLNCGALVASDAEWCGQCYASLKAPEEPVATAPGAGLSEPPATTSVAPPGEPDAEEPGTVVPIQVREGEPAWPCPLCGNRNPIELNQCVVCGTPFARLFLEPERAPRMEPGEAAKWSLLLPGLGHLKSGRAMDGVARMILFVWTLGTLFALLVSRFGKGGLGVTTPLVVLFLLGWLLVHVESVVDAYRVAAGDEPLVSSRALLWASATLVFLFILLGTMILLPAARGG